MKTFFKCMALCTALALSAGASATAVSYQFAGQVSGDTLERGWSNFAGSFTFDSAAVDSIADPSTASYAHAGAPWGMSVTFDGLTTVDMYSAFNLNVTNSLVGGDQLGLLASDGFGGFLTLTLINSNGSLFANDAIPLPAGGLTLDDFDVREFSYESADYGWLSGILTSFSCSNCSPVAPPSDSLPPDPSQVPPPDSLPPAPSQVPEPGTIWLLPAGLAGLYFSLLASGRRQQTDIGKNERRYPPPMATFRYHHAA